MNAADRVILGWLIGAMIDSIKDVKYTYEAIFVYKDFEIQFD